MKNKSITRKGVSLVVLVITIIVIIILAGTVIISLSDNKIIENATEAKNSTNARIYREELERIYIQVDNPVLGMRDVFGKIEEKLKRSTLNGSEVNIFNKYMTIKTKDGYAYTIVEGEIMEGIKAILDISEGPIELYKTYYKQAGVKYEYERKCVITGKSETNTVKVRDVGDYDITIKNLNISSTTMCAIDANRERKATGLNVVIRIEGYNKLIGGGNGPAIGLAYATANIDGVTDGSTFTLEGNGTLEASVTGSHTAIIGSGYSGTEVAAGPANNITINSGNYILKAKTNGAGIGGGLRKAVNNITINGGNIQIATGMRSSIGGSPEGAASKNITINGGVLDLLAGEYGAGIGGVPNVLITGGIVNITGNRNDATITKGTSDGTITIAGGTLNLKARQQYNPAIDPGTEDETIKNVIIKGGNVYLEGKYPIAKGNTEKIPVNEKGQNVYKTQIKLRNITSKVQVTSFKTSDNINYGIKDMYTDEAGNLYVYLPEGSRQITMQAGGNTYTGTVVTANTNNTLVEI